MGGAWEVDFSAFSSKAVVRQHANPFDLVWKPVHLSAKGCETWKSFSLTLSTWCSVWPRNSIWVELLSLLSKGAGLKVVFIIYAVNIQPSCLVTYKRVFVVKVFFSSPARIVFIGRNLPKTFDEKHFCHVQAVGFSGWNLLHDQN